VDVTKKSGDKSPTDSSKLEKILPVDVHDNHPHWEYMMIA